ncbi:nucleotidyltransferase family protein [Pengzhenrongella frigida]|uniref:Molybdenum cofactor guanylyltransferase n=1 Tax=Pengzhenrongella frigida TaxID=1259133 RepID=A0A4Q5MZJ6_9MICO|nr:nucleotidyltransferase family protein [Cellulomonas sp. HLT2-17]RYV51150.1 molybdenum cofactor guanylyltransferase [Cellulomonas sp. HLT2-17]
MTTGESAADEPDRGARPPTSTLPRVGVVIPAGGTARRLGGTDKPSLEVGGRSILARLVADLRPLPVVVVGPRPEGAEWPGVVWCTEDPPGGGPAAALAAGVRALPDVDVIVAIAGDQPFAASAVPRLVRSLAADPTADAALGLDDADRVQPLLAAYRAAALRARLAGPVDGLAMRQVIAAMQLVRVRLTAPESVDVDDPADLAVARTMSGEG